MLVQVASLYFAWDKDIKSMTRRRAGGERRAINKETRWNKRSDKEDKVKRGRRKWLAVEQKEEERNDKMNSSEQKKRRGSSETASNCNDKQWRAVAIDDDIDERWRATDNCNGDWNSWSFLSISCFGFDNSISVKKWVRVRVLSKFTGLNDGLDEPVEFDKIHIARYAIS